MSTTYKCPICHADIGNFSALLICHNCHTVIDFINAKVTNSDKSPKYVKDSYSMFESICMKKPMFVFGKHELFTPEFCIENCVSYNSSKYITEETPSIFLGYSGVPAVMIKVALNNISKSLMETAGVLHPSDVNAGLLLYLADSYRETELTFEGMKALTALMAPTWFDCAEILHDNIKKNVTDWSNSELLYSYMICDKFPMVEKTTPMGILEVLSAFILNQCKFIHDKNDKLTFGKLEGSKRKSFGCVVRTVPELFVANNGTVTDESVAWLFATNSQAYLSKDIDNYVDMAAGFNILWNRYGVPVSHGSSILDGDNSLNAYIKYWNKVRERLQ